MNLIYRRVRQSEFNLLKRFILSSKAEHLEFTMHDEWQKKALEELNSKNNSRVAFAAFQSNFNLNGFEMFDENSSICGCIFLKCSKINNTGELKNLITIRETEFESLGDSAKKICDSIKTKLVEKAIKFCEQRDFYKVETELLQSEMQNFVPFFLELGFRVTHLKEKYLPGKFVYILEKQIGETFQGDPFNNEQKIKWLSQCIMPNYLVDIVKIPDIKYRTRYMRITFKKCPETKLLNNLSDKIDRKNYEYQFNLFGDICILEEYTKAFIREDRILKCFNENSHFKFLIADGATNLLKSICSLHNIKIIDSELLKEIAGGEKSTLNIPIKSESNIKGVITVLEQNTIERFLNKKLMYFLVSGAGSGIDLRRDPILVFFCPQWNNESNVIIGYAEITEIIEDPFPEDAEKSYTKYYSLIEKTDYEFYKRSDSSNIKIVLCSKIKVLKKTIHIKPSKEKPEQIPFFNYIHNELVNKMANSVYIDETIGKVITESRLKKSLYSSDSSSIPRFFISYSHSNKNNEYFTYIIKKLKKSEILQVILDEETTQAGDNIYKFIAGKYDAIVSFYPNENLYNSKWIALETSRAIFAKEKYKKNFKWIPYSLDKDFLIKLKKNKINILKKVDQMISELKSEKKSTKQKNKNLLNLFNLELRDLKKMKESIEVFLFEAVGTKIPAIYDEETANKAYNEIIFKAKELALEKMKKYPK